MAPRNSRRRSSRTRTRVSTTTTLSIGGGRDQSGTRVLEAANKLAEGIRIRSRQFSKKIPPSVHVGQGTPKTATIYSNAPNSYPIETGARHPLFAQGPKPASNNDPAAEGTGWDHWYPMKKILFMEEGAALKLDDAAEAYGQTVDDWMKALGW